MSAMFDQKQMLKTKTAVINPAVKPDCTSVLRHMDNILYIKNKVMKG